MTTPLISIDDFMRKFPPRKRLESVISAHKKEIFLLRRKGYSIPEIVTFFELAVGQKVSRFAVRDYLSSQTKKKQKPDSSTNHEPTTKEPTAVPYPDKQQSGKKKSAAPSTTLPRTSKQQERENRAAKYDT
jgi:hypothetical protein